MGMVRGRGDRLGRNARDDQVLGRAHLGPPVPLEQAPARHREERDAAHRVEARLLRPRAQHRENAAYRHESWDRHGEVGRVPAVGPQRPVPRVQPVLRAEPDRESRAGVHRRQVETYVANLTLVRAVPPRAGEPGRLDAAHLDVVVDEVPKGGLEPRPPPAVHAVADPAAEPGAGVPLHVEQAIPGLPPSWRGVPGGGHRVAEGRSQRRRGDLPGAHPPAGGHQRDRRERHEPDHPGRRGGQAGDRSLPARAEGRLERDQQRGMGSPGPLGRQKPRGRGADAAGRQGKPSSEGQVRRDAPLRRCEEWQREGPAARDRDEGRRQHEEQERRDRLAQGVPEVAEEGDQHPPRERGRSQRRLEDERVAAHARRYWRGCRLRQAAARIEGGPDGAGPGEGRGALLHSHDAGRQEHKHSHASGAGGGPDESR
mmetsp:Transcript_13287/g.32619  ORF Transcript_13287/g.32619 Transcript_13287/m.32619 type:complete len:427 (-) Transcript_13287:564-1844(-)